MNDIEEQILYTKRYYLSKIWDLHDFERNKIRYLAKIFIRQEYHYKKEKYETGRMIQKIYGKNKEELIKNAKEYMEYLESLWEKDN